MAGSDSLFFPYLLLIPAAGLCPSAKLRAPGLCPLTPGPSLLSGGFLLPGSVLATAVLAGGTRTEAPLLEAHGGRSELEAEAGAEMWGCHSLSPLYSWAPSPHP